ncbi:MAG TPA: class I SAM-dependent methyltransferase [Gaiellaceae bacterium]|nr:class I SAM-dependent methyltransferase [Gaiellaceae bacterium]
MRRGRDRRTKVIQHHWDHRADTFDDEAGHGLLNDEQRRAWQELLSRLAGRPPRRVLDVGCGTGFLALRLGELGHEVTGVDLSPQMIDRARGKAEQEALQIEFRAGDATALADADGTYDLVVGRHLIWNLPHPERAVAEWLRVLRPGGRLALVEGKWADNTALQRSYSRGVSRILNRVLDATSALALRGGGHPSKLVNSNYFRVEVQLPFSGGPSAGGLAAFLDDNGVHDITVEPLMDETLWGGPPEFPRYLAVGTRPPSASQ